MQEFASCVDSSVQWNFSRRSACLCLVEPECQTAASRVLPNTDGSEPSQSTTFERSLPNHSAAIFGKFPSAKNAARGLEQKRVASWHKIADTSQESETTYLEQAKKKNSHQRLILPRLRRIAYGGTCLPQCFPEDGPTKLLVIASSWGTSRDHQSHC